MEVCLDMIMNPEAPFALRLSGQLLFGLARVYRRQVGYLLQDCNDALNKLQDVRICGGVVVDWWGCRRL